MSLADEAIADLDSFLAERGQWVRLKRLTTGPEGQLIPFEVSIRANVRAASPTDLVEAGARETAVVISPSGLGRFPGMPRRDDRLIVEGDPMAITEVMPVKVDGRLVRIKLNCRG